MATGHVREYVKRVASIDLENYPQWDLKRSLPRLPVPDLQSTMEMYLNVMRSILTEEQYQRTKMVAEDFSKPGGIGEVLQEKLRKLAEIKDNWVFDWWLDDMYLKVKLPLPINSNPGMVFPRQHFEDRTKHIRYAARLISGILDYKTIIDARGLPVDRARHSEKGQPLCMAQYYRLFNSYRVPGVKKDSLIFNNTSQLVSEPEHIIVICKNQMFVLDVVVNFSRLNEDDLYTQLMKIVTMVEENRDRVHPVGILTAGYRDKWANARMQLMEDSTNRDSLDTIERCTFVLCLDDRIPISFNHQRSIDETKMNVRDDVSLILQMLHGLGSDVNSANRWFDKTMQFIISEDGSCGLNYEHSPSEGIAVIQLIEHLLRYMDEVHERKLHRMQSMIELSNPRKLQWKISESVRQEMKSTISHLDRQIDDLDMYVMRFEEFGRDFPKSKNMSPDAFIQLALQLTFYKIHGHLVSTYESASIRRFRLGRVDNIRSNSPVARDWVRAMVGHDAATDDEKMALLRKAMAYQTKIMMKTILGQGVDNHLLGLREMAVDLGLPVPDIFTDEAYHLSNHFTLSTSQVPTTMDAFMCYGPVVPDGYGVCYNPHPHNIVVCVSSFISNTETMSDYFAHTLESSFLQMHELCMKTEDAQTSSCRDITKHETNESKSPKKGRQLVRQKQTQNAVQSNGGGIVAENGD